ncbi:MAG: glycosyltransferase family 2 protein [Nitrospirae bacterium]|nr:glycosyltransferase family 2 protein [Nitrospirota bacterium]
MAALFVLSLGLIAYGYVVYPLVVAGMGLWSRRVYRKDDRFIPSVTLIISAYNEEQVIEEKLRNALALDYPRDQLEIIVASESSDGTNDIVRRYGARDVVLRAFSGRLGKSATLYRVVPSTRGDVLIFSDANSMYQPDAIRKLVRNFADPSVGAVIGQMRYGEHSRSVGAQGEGVYWSYDRWLRKHAARVQGLVPGINGALFGIRKSLYLPMTEERGDDYELCTRIAIHGHAVAFEPEAVAVEAASETTPQQFRRKMRLVRWNTMSSLLLLREALTARRWVVAFQLVSHRLLRYSVPVWLLVALGSSAVLAGRSTTFALLLAIQGAFYALSLAGLAADAAGVRLPRLCMIPSYFLMVNSAAFMGILSGISRGQVTTWQKVR